ncbi:MAG: hypothetical protein KatS3mg057_2619 [Herpetosiphonaceae bacterium]|nr:MAG: hypothetical protein KatS3mg057_2619 [Herpetosiphonaceae bacterium]
MVRCPTCEQRCTYIGDQPGALARFGRRMELWNCPKCGTTISRMRQPRPMQFLHVRGRAIKQRERRRPLFKLRVVPLNQASSRPDVRCSATLVAEST